MPLNHETVRIFIDMYIYLQIYALSWLFTSRLAWISEIAWCTQHNKQGGVIYIYIYIYGPWQSKEIYVPAHFWQQIPLHRLYLWPWTPGRTSGLPARHRNTSDPAAPHSPDLPSPHLQTAYYVWAPSPRQHTVIMYSYPHRQMCSYT